jgi:hypothetical protein
MTHAQSTLGIKYSGCQGIPLQLCCPMVQQNKADPGITLRYLAEK